MPTYEYECEKCGDVFELRQKFSDDPLTMHEECGGAVHRLLSAPALQFKGSGWYVTDYPKGGKSSDNGGANKSEGSGGGSSDSDSGKATPSSSSSESKSGSESKASSETKSGSDAKSSSGSKSGSSDTT